MKQKWTDSIKTYKAQARIRLAQMRQRKENTKLKNAFNKKLADIEKQLNDDLIKVKEFAFHSSSKPKLMMPLSSRCRK